VIGRVGCVIRTCHPAAIERLASVIAAETGIATAVQLDANTTDRTKVPVESALAEVQVRRGYPLSPEQESLVRHIAGDGRGIDAVIGVAGSGKTTALEALGLAWTWAGYRVLGSATSGQAARNLGDEANIDTHTVASLTRSLESGRIRLGPTDLIVLDEAGMTTDRDLLKVLNAAGAARAHVVMVGDPLQLAAVGPGGAMEAVSARHPGLHTLTENRRQSDEAERAALGELRHGAVEEAVDYYAGTGRIRTQPDRHSAIEAAVDAYLGDVAAGHDTLLLAWRRDHVAEMNALARKRLQDTGALSRVEMTAPGGTHYALDDRVVFTAPNHDAGVVTSQTATVFLSDDQGPTPALILELADGRRVRLQGEAIDAAHLAHGYAMTVHRCQGATVDTAHVLADGGGRELGYVAMSRAREATHVYLAADDADQAREDLVREWIASRRVRWAIDTGWPAEAAQAGEVPLHLIYPGLERAAVKAEAEAIAAVIPPPVSAEQIRLADRRLEDLEAVGERITWGQGRWADPALAEAAEVVRVKEVAQHSADQAARWARSPVGRAGHHHQAEAAGRELAGARDRLEVIAAPHRADLEAEITEARAELVRLRDGAQARTAFDRAHPGAAPRLARSVREAHWPISAVRRDVTDVALGSVETVDGPSMVDAKAENFELRPGSVRYVEYMKAEAVRQAAPQPHPALAPPGPRMKGPSPGR